MLRGIHKFLDKSSWDEARNVVDVEDLSIPGGFGQWTPHHIACKRNAPIDIIKSLIANSPESLDKFDACNRLPIHYAADCGASFEVLKLLVEACPKSTLGVDNEMKIPLHILLQNSSEEGRMPSVDVIKLLASDPSAVWIADSNEKMPIHYAAELVDHLSTEHFQALVEADHNTVLAQSKNGMTALHIALQTCEKEIPLKTIKSLLGLTTDGKERLDADYEVTRIMSDEDLLPLHYACKKYSLISDEIFHLLLERCPEAASTAANKDGFPLDILESTVETRTDAFNKKSDMIFAYNSSLLPYCKQAERVRRIGDTILADMSKRIWLSDVNKSLWIWMCTLPKEEDEEGVIAEVIDRVLKTFNDSEKSKFLTTIQTLSEDDKKLPLFELASDKSRELMAPFFRVGKRYSVKKRSISVSYDTVEFDAIDTYNKDNQVVMRLLADKQQFENQVLLHQNVQSMSKSIGLSCPIVSMIAKYEINTDESFFTDFQEFINYDGIIDMESFHHVIIQESVGEELKSFLENSDKDGHLEVKALAQMILCLHNAGYGIKKLNVTDLCAKNGRVMLRNLGSLTNLTNLTHKKYFGAVDDLNTSNLPPEMIVKLNREEIKQYEIYWKQVINDYLIASEFSEDDLRESTKFQAYLKENNCSVESFWQRVHHNQKLWQKIRPRRFNDEYFVIKCYRYDSKGEVFNADSLPYQLVQWDKSLEVWMFAAFIFEQITSETLFHTDKNHVFINDVDYSKLHNWNMTDPYVANRMQNVTDPFARDFLRVSLTTSSTRLSTMKSVLEHNFFKYSEDDSQYSAIKKGYLALEKVLQQDLLVLEDLNHRTKRLDVVSTNLQLQFEHAVWRQLKWDYDVEEVKFPVGFVFLPYALKYSGEEDEVIASADEETARMLSLAVIDVLHYVNLANVAKGFHEGHHPSFQQFLDLNASVMVSEKTKPVAICRDILIIWNNTEDLFSNFFETYIPSNLARMVSHKLVSDVLRGVIDYEICTNISGCADQVLDAISTLSKAVGHNDKSDPADVLNRQLSDLCRGQCFDLTLETKDRVLQDLSRLFEKFCKSPVTSIVDSFNSACLRLLKCYSSEKDCYVYAVDEFTGTPFISNDSSARTDLTSDAMKAFIPTTLCIAKSHFSQGLDHLFGNGDMDDIIAEQNKCWIGNFSPTDCKNELLLIQNILNDNLRSRRHFDCGQDVLKYLEDYHQKSCGRSKYFGLHRLLSPNNLLLWTEKSSWMLASLEVQKDLVAAKVKASDSVVSRQTCFSKSNEDSEYNRSRSRTPLITIKCDENSPAKVQNTGDSPFDNNVVDSELIKSAILKREETNEFTKTDTNGGVMLREAVNQLRNFSLTDSNTVITDDYSGSETSMPVPVQTKSDDASEPMYYSSTDSEKSDTQTTSSQKSNKPSPGIRNFRSRRKKSKPTPGETTNEVSKKKVDINRFHASRLEI